MKNYKYLTGFIMVLSFAIVPTFISAQTTSSFDKYVTLGQTDPDVKVLQQALNSLGYTVAPTGYGSLGNETTYYGPATTKAIQRFQCAALSICQGSPYTNGYGNFGPLTRRTLAQKYSSPTATIQSKTATYLPIAYPTPSPSTGGVPNQNQNIGTIAIRAIVANIDEVGNKYGSMGEKFTQAKLTEVDSALQRLNTFVKQSSYGKAQLQWKTSGVYELGSGVCNHDAWNDKTHDLIQRALQAADSQVPLADYSYYLIVHPQPDCPDGALWSFEGHAQFKAYTLNGRTVHLRGVRISDLSDEYLFHEFGHSLGYQPNTGISHPDYLNCPVTAINNETKVALSGSCQRIYDWYTGDIPVFTMMSAKRGILSDYNAPEKEIIGWLSGSNSVTTTAGKYTLSPLEQTGPNPKVLKIPVTDTNYVVYVSFRQPIGYTYPNAPGHKPNGVILDVFESNNITNHHFLVTNSTNRDAPLQIGVPYRIGTSGPVITLTGISNNLASVTVSSGVTAPTNPTATIDQNSLTSSSGTPTLTGTAHNVAQPFGISISDSGGKVWTSGTISVSNNRWSSTLNQALPAGAYQVQVYSNNTLLTSGTLTINLLTPTCALSTNKSSYTLGETITYSWTSKNATYASFQQDTSGKDHLSLPGDKMPANGSRQVTASIIGSPSVTLIVGGASATGSCTKVVNITSGYAAPLPTPTPESVSFDQTSLKVLPGNSFTLSGGTSAKSGSFTVAIVGPNYSGGTDWNTVGNALKGGASYTGASKTIPLSGAVWTASFGGITSEGYYSVLIYDSSYNLLGTAKLWVTSKG